MVSILQVFATKTPYVFLGALQLVLSENELLVCWGESKTARKLAPLIREQIVANSSARHVTGPHQAK
jgi:hypothetical protein